MAKITYQFSSDATTQAGYLSIGDVPSLIGSEKQVAWAETIRAGMVKEFVAMILKVAKVSNGTVIRTDVDHIAKVETTIRAALDTPAGKPVAAAMDKIFANAEAKFWIESRNMTPIQMVKAASC